MKFEHSLLQYTCTFFYVTFFPPPIVYGMTGHPDNATKIEGCEVVFPVFLKYSTIFSDFVMVLIPFYNII